MRQAITRLPTTPPDPSRAAEDAQRALWKLLDTLALCRHRFKLTPNSLSVLRALISFLPKATPILAEALVVWPSNRTLCERADGMDERTLRRHLDRLVKAGLIRRQSSSNGKRFALRHRAIVVAAFGFDLQPLRDRTDEITAAARLMRSEAEQCAILRIEILNLLQSLAQGANPAEDEADIRRMLRRRADLGLLVATRDRLLANQPETVPLSGDMTVSDRQIDRLQQKTEEESFDSVCRESGWAVATLATKQGQGIGPALTDDDISLEDCLKATTEGQALAQEPVQSWSGLLRLAETLAPMIGIQRELADHARRSMGPLPAAISILCVIQRIRRIRNPAAYLRRLATLAETGQYSLSSLVRSALRERFAGANHAPTQVVA